MRRLRRPLGGRQWRCSLCILCLAPAAAGGEQPSSAEDFGDQGYVLRRFGADGCPSGFDVESAEECKHAALKLGLTGVDAVSSSKIPTGCVSAPTQNSQHERVGYWNTATEGSIDSSIAPICKTGMAAALGWDRCCSGHKSCSAFAGFCCPTNDQVMLGCCSGETSEYDGVYTSESSPGGDYFLIHGETVQWDAASQSKIVPGDAEADKEGEGHFATWFENEGVARQATVVGDKIWWDAPFFQDVWLKVAKPEDDACVAEVTFTETTTAERTSTSTVVPSTTTTTAAASKDLASDEESDAALELLEPASKSPTHSPTPEPTSHPTSNPTPAPTPAPTPSPTPRPTAAATASPTGSPTPAPTSRPTTEPTAPPTEAPTAAPTAAPAPEVEMCPDPRNDYEKDTAFDPVDMDTALVAKPVPNVSACQAVCAQNKRCFHFSYYSTSLDTPGQCHLQDIFALRQKARFGFWAGPKMSWCQYPPKHRARLVRLVGPEGLSFDGMGENTYVWEDFRCMVMGGGYQPSFVSRIMPKRTTNKRTGGSVLDCQEWCRNTTGCVYFSIEYPSRTCSLAGPAAKLRFPISKTVSGPPSCDGAPRVTPNCSCPDNEEVTTTMVEMASTEMGTTDQRPADSVVSDAELLGAPVSEQIGEKTDWLPATATWTLALGALLAGVNVARFFVGAHVGRARPPELRMMSAVDGDRGGYVYRAVSTAERDP